MILYNYFYEGTPIQKSRFENNVPEDWKQDHDDTHDYTWGNYRAMPRDADED